MLTNLVAYVMKECNTIQGKKAFQKIFYFLTEGGLPTGLSYVIYHYGPYSSQLDFQTDMLEVKGAISISTQGIAYKIKKGENVEALSEGLGEYAKRIDEILSALPWDNPLQLELLSTIHYVSKVQKNIYRELDKNLVIAEVKKIKKDKFPEDRIREAYDYLLEQESLRF